MMMDDRTGPDPEKSPRWSNTTKTIVGLTLAALFIVLLFNFRAFMGPVLLAVIISYLFYPLALRIQRLVRIPWRLLVGFLYLLAVIILLSLVTWGGITLVEQIQNLINFLQSAITGLPDFIARITATPQVIGPFTLDWNRLDVATILNQALGLVQPILSQAGALVGTIASGAAGIVGWTVFSFVLSYFLVSETQGTPSRLFNLHIPGYRDDFKRMGQELGIIWNVFLRGELMVFVITTAIYTVTMGILGVRYYFGLALLAGLARFLPYIGQIISLTTDVIVAFSQGYTFFGLTPEYYALTVLLTAWLTDTMIDNLISPRIFSNALRIHPAAVMVCALIGFNTMGIIGIVLAAPVLATIKLLFDYTVRKLLDMDPWSGFERTPPPTPIAQMIAQFATRVFHFLRDLYERGKGWITNMRKQRASN
jgi:predicted PurR-regulated permease PerM